MATLPRKNQLRDGNLLVAAAAGVLNSNASVKSAFR